MYQKRLSVVLFANIILTIFLSMSRSYFIKASEVSQRQITYIVKQEDTNSKLPVINYNHLKHEYVVNATEDDVYELMKIVEAEAGCEDSKGKLLVANVIINRVKNPKFPNTIKEVIYQKNNVVTQFSPVSNGKINKVQVTEETKVAVYSALYGKDESKGALFFMARKHSDPSNVRWFDKHLKYLFTYGGHEFFS